MHASKTLVLTHLKETSYASLIQGVPKNVIDKKLLVGTAHDFNSQFLNLFGFSISVSFVWCIISKIWAHLSRVTAVFRRRTCFFSVQIQQKNSYHISEMLMCHAVSRICHWLSFGIIWVCLITNVWKGILNLEKKNIFPETPFNKRSAKYATQNDGMVQRGHKCIRASRDSRLNKVLDNFFLKL